MTLVTFDRACYPRRACDFGNGSMRRLLKTMLAFPTLMLIAAPVLGQVVVNVRTDKAEYLAGEPVFVIVDVKNVGVEPVGYSYCDGDVKLNVPNGEPNTAPN